MLHQLARYADQANLVTEPGFTAKDVRWGIACDARGRPTGLIDLAGAKKGNKGRRFKAVPHLTLPEMKRGGSGTRHFLVDALQVVLGVGADDDPKIAAKHSYFVSQLGEAAGALPVLGGIAQHLAEPHILANLREQAREQKAKPTENATFAIDGEFLAESAEWHDWWRSFRATLNPKPEAADDGDRRMISLMSGRPVVPVRTQNKVKGLASVGGQPSGDVLASFKQDAFRSFGLVQAENAAVSATEAVRYPAALSHMIRNQSKRFKNIIVAYWYDFEAEIDPMDTLEGYEKEEELRVALAAVRDFLECLQRGTPEASHLERNYCAYTLSGAAGRVMVRDVMTGPFAVLARNVLAWFEDLDIIHRNGARPAPPPKFFAVLAACVRDLNDLSAPSETALWRSALANTPIPHDAHTNALARAHMDVVADRAPRHARFGLIKAALNRYFKDLDTKLLIKKRYATVSKALDENHTSDAYHSGRLMAVLANLQYSALGDVGAGVIQRYYASACASPALVLGRLVRNSQFHLNKLDIALRIWYEKKIGDILSHVEGQFPDNLDLYQQSLFALGYYHQQAFDRTKKTKIQTTSTTDPSNAPAAEENN